MWVVMCCACAAPGAIRNRRARLETDPRVDRVVESVNDVMRATRMVRLALELLRDRAGAHVGGHVAHALAQPMRASE